MRTLAIVLSALALLSCSKGADIYLAPQPSAPTNPKSEVDQPPWESGGKDNSVTTPTATPEPTATPTEAAAQQNPTPKKKPRSIYIEQPIRQKPAAKANGMTFFCDGDSVGYV